MMLYPKPKTTDERNVRIMINNRVAVLKEKGSAPSK
jgi:hypothetical protein